MTRIAELQKKYPTIPQDVIVKWEVLRYGIRDTEDLDKVSVWKRAAFSYQSYDQDVTLKEMADKRPGARQPGLNLEPVPIIMKSGLGAQVQRSYRSPYEIRDVGGGKMALFERDEQVDADIFFLIDRSAKKEEPVTRAGTPVSTLIYLRPVCFWIMPVRHCEYFNTGDQCKFCNFNGTQEDARSVGLNRSATINLEETLEAYKIVSANTRFVEGRFEMGGFVAGEAESKIHLRFVEQIAKTTSDKPNLTVHGQPLTRKELQRLKDAGVDSVYLQPEVWDPRLLTEVAPGKAKRDGSQGYRDGCLDVVDILGVGNLAANFVGGVTLIPENGHKTWQEARDSMIEGNDWSIKHGMIPTFTNLRLPPGSVYGANPALREKAPPTEFYLDLALAHHKTMTETGLYEKYNRLMICAFDCSVGPYMGEIGMIELSGDLGKWMGAVVPEEQNWLSRVIASLKSPARA